MYIYYVFVILYLINDGIRENVRIKQYRPNFQLIVQFKDQNKHLPIMYI